MKFNLPCQRSFALATLILLFSIAAFSQTQPVVTCPLPGCLPGARAAYLVNPSGEPWGQGDNITAMNAVFGAGNWDPFTFDAGEVASVFSPAHDVVFIDGSNDAGYLFNDYLSLHLPALENWVAAGGALFLNCAPNGAPATIALGFNGVELQSSFFAFNVLVSEPGHPAFNGPFTPVAVNGFNGNHFLHAQVTGALGMALLTAPDGGVGLAEKRWGAGKVIFGGMTMPAYHSPMPEAQNMRQNILAYLNNVCGQGRVLHAAAGVCEATENTDALNATATDPDGSVVSLTHDFAAAAANTTLNGATFPVGTTPVTWTATDNDGNTATCTFSVTVFEDEKPVATCPADLTMNTDAGACSAVFNFSATATDNCGATPTITANPPSGSEFPIGNTTVTVRATDASFNTGECSFVVTVVGNPETCNGLDDDCDGQIDEDAPGNNQFYADADGDGYGDPANIVTACTAPPGFTDNGQDCDDLNYYVRPGMYENCNEIDDNCDGQIDEGVAPTWFADMDGDGYGSPANTQAACNQPQGYVYDASDCDDSNAYIHPGTPEDCTNQTDENCDGILGDNNFSISETHTDVHCNTAPDGSITLDLVPQQNYPFLLWSNGVCCTTTQTNLAPGTYQVTVTNECGTSKTQSILVAPSQSPTLLVGLTGTNLQCPGTSTGGITLDVQGGCLPYTYYWNTGSTEANLSGLGGGTYSVIVTDACGCSQTGSIDIVEPPMIYLYGASSSQLLNGNYWVELGISGGTKPYEFRRSTGPGTYTDWDPVNGFINVPAGSFDFEARDSQGCPASITLSFDVFVPRTAVVTTSRKQK